MNFRGLDLNLLVAMDALLTERSTTRAGERIHLSQSAMSGALARLRHFFDDEILTPVGQRMVLTPLGEELAKPVREALLAIEAIVHKDQTFEPATSTRHFRIMLSDYAAVILMTRAIQEVQRLAPHASIELVPFSERYVQSLEHGDVDLLLIAKPYGSRSQPCEELFRDDYTCVVWAGNAAVGEEFSLQHYLGSKHAVVRFGRDQDRAAEEQFFVDSDIDRDVHVVAMGFSLLPQLIVGTSLVATVQSRLAQHYAEWLPLRLLKPPVDIPPLVEIMQWHNARNEDRGLRWLRQVLKEAAQASSVTPGPARPTQPA
jgi:LysR family nod box-dependent transcriptional activator